MAENRKRQDGRKKVDKRAKVWETLLSGFTLIEVLMTIVVLAILAAVAVPGFSVWLPNYRLKAAARDMVSNFQLAKLTAVKRNTNCAITFNQAIGARTYDYVVYDSDVEADFARSLEQSEDIRVYAKLPGWFKIDTPLGNYNPDWAVLVDRDNEEKLYFVVETKGSMFFDMLRPAEQAKIDCGHKHFKALNEKVGFAVADRFETFMDRVV